jgi:hypothetical protein
LCVVRMVICLKNGHFGGAERGEMRGKDDMFVAFCEQEMHLNASNRCGVTWITSLADHCFK